MVVSRFFLRWEKKIITNPNIYIKRIIASEKPDIQQKMLSFSKKEYQNLILERRKAEALSNLRMLHWIGTQLNMMATLQGRTHAFFDAIETFNLALKIEPNYAPAHWGLGFAYYNVTIDDLIIRGKMITIPSGLQVPIPDTQGANLMIKAYQEAKIAVNAGYGPSDPNYLEMSLDKLTYYCREQRRKTKNPGLCNEIP